MACYEAWNSAIASYFMAGVAQGSHIFLSLDEEAIDDIAVRFLDEKIDVPLDNFVAVVQEHCMLQSDNKINLGFFRQNTGNIPVGVGFLGVMVIAAYHMQEEEGIDESNYFLRLREVLHLPTLPGRPDGMPSGSEEPLWIAWNDFLKYSGFQPTAERGSGPQTYIRYALSQAILRDSDKQFLGQRYREKNLALQLDRDQLGFWLSRQQIPRKHLNEGLHHSDPARVWEFYQAAYRLYETGDWLNGNVRRQSSEQPKSHNIECGIYREQTLYGDTQYHIFPRQPERSRSNQLFVSEKDSNITKSLRPLKEGYFWPLWVQDPFVDEPIRFPLSGDPYIQNLIFPKRDFWILSTEPDVSHGTFATWKPYPELGEKLLVLCKNGPFAQEMSHLKKETLVDWAKEVQCSGWVEYYDCMVLSYDFGGFIGAPDCRALADSLAPRTQASIALSGGLRDSNQNAWLAGFPPSLKIYGFEKEFEVSVMATSGIEAFCDEVSQQQEICLPKDLEPDVYEVEVKWNGRRVSARVFRIISWDNIQENPCPEELINSQHISTAGIHLFGPIIIDDKNNTREVDNA